VSADPRPSDSPIPPHPTFALGRFETRARALMYARLGLMTIGLSATVARPSELRAYLTAQTAPDYRTDLADCVIAPGGAQPDIAILEDDETLRVLFESMLDRMGFEVGSSTTGEGFLQLFREASEAGRPFDLSILDLTIHDGMGGRQTFEHLRAIDPDARCIVTSGYSNDPAMVEPVRHGFVAALRKPFHVDGLRAALRAAGIALNH